MILNDLAQKTLGTSGVREAVSATQLNVEAVVFSCPSTNTGLTWVGGSSVSSSRFVKAISPGDSFCMAVNVSDQSDSSFIALDSIYWDAATTGNKLNVGYLQSGS